MRDNKLKSINIEKVAIKGSLSKRVYAELKRAILEGHFPPGELLPEDFLTNATGASRTPVREALMKLQGDGLVEIVPRKGARVLEMNSDELAELVEARVLFETVFYDRAIKNIPMNKIEKIMNAMTTLIDEMKSAESDSQLWVKKRLEYSSLDFKFHRTLVEATNNRFLLKYYDMLLDRVIIYSHHTVIKHPAHFLQSAKEHEAILNAILNGENEKVKELIDAHLRQLIPRLTSA